MKLVKQDSMSVLILTDEELRAVRSAISRFAMQPMQEIADEGDGDGGKLWHLWRTAQAMDLEIRDVMT